MIKSNDCKKCIHYLICKNAKAYKEKIEELLKINTDDTFIISIDCKHFRPTKNVNTIN